MTIKEVEEKTGLMRSNIRFYEKESLILPERNEKNGYREYSQKDLEDIKKIAYLRTLGISIGDIRKIISGEVPLKKVISRQVQVLGEELLSVQKARGLCQKMLLQKDISYDEMKVERYTEDLNGHWEQNKRIFKADSVSLFYLWGGTVVWGVITAICLVVALLSFTGLPSEIPIQWSDGMASSQVNKTVIFAYPAACVAIRYALRPFIWRWLYKNVFRICDPIADYLTNFICFLALSVEVFTILFVKGALKHVTIILFADAAVFIGFLLIAWYRALYKAETY